MCKIQRGFSLLLVKKLSNELFILISLTSLFQSIALVYWINFSTISVLGFEIYKHIFFS